MYCILNYVLYIELCRLRLGIVNKRGLSLIFVSRINFFNKSVEFFYIFFILV